MADLFQKAKSTINEHIKNIHRRRAITERHYEKIRKFRIFYKANKIL